LSIFDTGPEGMDVMVVVDNPDEMMTDGRADAVVVVTNLTDCVEFEFALFCH
jgi:hypothetical protein